MVDSLSIRQRHARPPAWLASARETVDSKTGEVVRAVSYHNGFRLSYHPAGVLEARGCLPKYLHGSNLDTMTRAEIEEAVQRLSEAAGLDPLFARVHQLDLAATMPMPHPVSRYLALLGAAPAFQRVTYPGQTVSYQNTLRSLNFYDKAREAGGEGYLLRFEVKYLKKLKKQFGRALVLADLYDPAFFPVLVSRWHAEYRRIRKVRRPVLALVSTPTQLRRQFEAIGLHAYGGEAEAIAAIEAWPLDTTRKGRLRSAIRETADKGTDRDDAAAIQELNAAMERTVRQVLGHEPFTRLVS